MPLNKDEHYRVTPLYINIYTITTLNEYRVDIRACREVINMQNIFLLT